MRWILARKPVSASAQRSGASSQTKCPVPSTTTSSVSESSRAKRWAPASGANASSSPQSSSTGTSRPASRWPAICVEVARAIELELAAPARGVGIGLPVLVERGVAHRRARRANHRAKALAIERIDQRLALAGCAQRLRHPVPLAVGEEAGRADHERVHGAGVLAGPAQSDQPAPVVHDGHAALDPELRSKALDRLYVAFPGARRVGLGVAEAREVGRERAPARSRERRHHARATCKTTRDSRGAAARPGRPPARPRGRRARPRPSRLGGRRGHRQPYTRSGARARRPGAPHHRAAPAPDPFQHRQSARQRAGGSGVPSRSAHGRRLRVRAARRGRRAPESRRADARRLRRPDPVPARPRGHRARRAVGVERRPVVGRAARRMRVGPRCARHEEPGGGRGGRGAGAGRGGLAPRGGRAAARVHLRRGDGRGASALSGCAASIPAACAPTSWSTRARAR